MAPSELIAAVRAWSAHVITQPDDPMRAKVDAVIAMATQWACETEKLDATFKMDWEGVLAAETARIRNMTPLEKALLAAGVEVENG